MVSVIPPRPFPTYDHLSYGDFLDNHMIPNVPFFLSSANTSTWPATKSFRKPNTQSTASLPNLPALRQYSHHVVPVANTLQPQFSEFERTEKSLGEVLDLWENQESEQGRGLYVKDWHLMAELEGQGKGVGEIYSVPECLRDDWLNPPYTPSPRTKPINSSASTSDFRFTYVGPALTYTPLHRDVYGSYSWSANVVGRKMWWFFPPDKLGRVKDENRELVFDVRHLEGEGGAMKVLQEEGEIIFIPSGWHHQVVNLDFCISINHNFFASPTLPHIYRALCVSQDRVEDSIADVKDMIIERLGTKGDQWEKEWFQEVQNLLQMDAGWGWRGFWETIMKNLKCPPSVNAPIVSRRDEWIGGVIKQYKKRREWVVLDTVRTIVEDIESWLV
ncbi:hypothetical protein CNBG_2044 [Cryptococcus deuterogattii R265]|uniref:uncharacterized protein n=1 Tax=Cryptococcus deuterogattii (strain R265) TaxID=294750 RepID=UPI0019374970|nr:hypothetical protein CNBG_2044 [Cryptococcus deuterogattii R265]